MKFLVDECLHTSLVAVAIDHGHEATHVSWRGLGGTKDWNLMPVIIDESFIFVTNNARDFLRLYRHEEAHSGLFIIVPNAEPAVQRQLFVAVLDSLEGQPEPFNEVIEISLDADDILIDRYVFAAPEQDLTEAGAEDDAETVDEGAPQETED